MSPSAIPSYVVVGARSSPGSFKSAQTMGRRVLKESEYVLMVLDESDGSEDNQPVRAGQKRGAGADSAAGSSMPRQSRKLEEPMDDDPEGPDFPRIRDFLLGVPPRRGGITITSKGMSVYAAPSSFCDPLALKETLGPYVGMTAEEKYLRQREMVWYLCYKSSRTRWS